MRAATITAPIPLMKRFKWLFAALGVIVVLATGVLVAGISLPEQHQFVRTLKSAQKPEAVFKVLGDVSGFPRWNRNLQTVQIIAPVEGHEATRQTFNNGMVMTIVTSESVRPTHLVRTMVDSGGPFSGSWTYDIKANATGCDVVLTENGRYPNPLFRVMARIFGLTKYADEHLQDLSTKLGEEGEIR